MSIYLDMNVIQNLQNLKDDLSSKLDYISKACKSFEKSTNSDKYEVLLELTALCTENESKNSVIQLSAKK